jgi:hypothetical protein
MLRSFQVDIVFRTVERVARFTNRCRFCDGYIKESKEQDRKPIEQFDNVQNDLPLLVLLLARQIGPRSFC